MSVKYLQSPSDKKQNSGPSKPREKTPTLQDNYEEVEMDIDSESGSPGKWCSDKKPQIEYKHMIFLM